MIGCCRNGDRIQSEYAHNVPTTRRGGAIVTPSMRGGAALRDAEFEGRPGELLRRDPVEVIALVGHRLVDALVLLTHSGNVNDGTQGLVLMGHHGGLSSRR